MNASENYSDPFQGGVLKKSLQWFRQDKNDLVHFMDASEWNFDMFSNVLFSNNFVSGGLRRSLTN